MPLIQSPRLVWFVLLQTETWDFRSASIIFAGFYQSKGQWNGLRSQDLFPFTIPVRTEAGKDAFRFAAPCDWNTLQVDLKLKAAARRRQDTRFFSSVSFKYKYVAVTQDVLGNFQNNCHFYQTGKDKEVLTSILDRLSATIYLHQYNQLLHYPSQRSDKTQSISVSLQTF